MSSDFHLPYNSDFIDNLKEQNCILSLHDLLKLIIHHKKFGYYTNKDNIISKDGDFITAPEISSLFGESIAFYLINYWLAKNKPNFVLVEFGSGNGTLLKDILNIFTKEKNIMLHCEVAIVDINSNLQKTQKKTLSSFSNLFNIKWYNSYSDFLQQVQVIDKNEKNKNSNKNGNKKKDKSISNESKQFFCISNEFLDVFPVYQFKKLDNNFQEIWVDCKNYINDKISIDKRKFNFIEKDISNSKTQNILNNYLKISYDFILSNNSSVLSSQSFSDAIFSQVASSDNSNLFNAPYKNPNILNEIPNNAYIEISDERLKFIDKIVELITNHKGCALFIDYGYTELHYKDTIHTIKDHHILSKHHLNLNRDTIIDVDFYSLVKYLKYHYMSKLNNIFITTQRDFLLNLQINVSLQKLLTITKDKTIKDNLILGYNRLIDNSRDNMGQKFKVMGFACD